MQRSGIISMENLFEVKAPLASFDTVDLGDDDRLDLRPVECLPATPEPEDSLAESVDSQSSNTSHNIDSELQWEGQTESEMLEGAVSDLAGTEVQQGVDETDSTKRERTGTAGSAETNSSESSAAGAVDILQRLKLRSKKHKETETKVKYQQIENSSDLSDHEIKSPLPDLKLSAYKICDSDTDSSDSDSYIQTGYITSVKGTKKGGNKKNKKVEKVKEKYNLSTPDSTPNASPKVFRPVLPPPLTEEERSQQSKRKAYEKRLQRLQVTTAPIERPRSTTPIDIFGLEEYAYISSPEKTPQNSKLEKLKITLPPEEFHPKGQSPRKYSKSESQDPHVFTFNEDLLFTHTKSALIVQEDKVKGQSPKKILIPPTLSPALSPRSQRCSSAYNLSPRSPRYYYTPTKTNTTVGNDWAKFEETDNVNPVSQEKEMVKERIVNNANHLKGNISTDSFELAAKDKLLNDEEILTVNVQVVNETKICDIKCECVAKAEANNANGDENHTQTSNPVEFASFNETEKMDVPIFADFDQVDNNETKHPIEDTENDIWVPHESNTQSEGKSEKIPNSNSTDSNIGEALKEIIDNAFKEETFELDFEEKESICDSFPDDKTVPDTENHRTGAVPDNKTAEDTANNLVIGQKEAYVTDCINQISSPQLQN